MMEAASGLLVSRKVATPGGTVVAISVMVSSAMTPGPLGMAETNPNAEVPYRTAMAASATLLMQQILTRGCKVDCYWGTAQ